MSLHTGLLSCCCCCTCCNLCSVTTAAAVAARCLGNSLCGEGSIHDACGVFSGIWAHGRVLHVLRDCSARNYPHGPVTAAFVTRLFCSKQLWSDVRAGCIILSMHLFMKYNPGCLVPTCVTDYLQKKNKITCDVSGYNINQGWLGGNQNASRQTCRCGEYFIRLPRRL